LDEGGVKNNRRFFCTLFTSQRRIIGNIHDDCV
jgi:hypothetical protein